MEKYFCGTSLLHLILVTVCEKAAEHKVFTATPEEEPQTELNDTPSHGIKTWFIRNRQEISWFLVAPPHFWATKWNVEGNVTNLLPNLIFALIPTQTVFSLSWAVHLNTCLSECILFLHDVFVGSQTFFFFLSFFHFLFFFFSWAGFIAVWVKNKYFFSSSGKPKDTEPNSISFSLALAFPSSWNCDWVHESEARWGGRPAATPRSLPFLHKHKNPNKESAQRGDRCVCYQRRRDEERIENERGVVTKGAGWPFGRLGQSPWSFEGSGLVSGECRPPGKRHGPQSGLCFLCERRGEPHSTDSISLL